MNPQLPRNAAPDFLESGAAPPLYRDGQPLRPLRLRDLRIPAVVAFFALSIIPFAAPVFRVTYHVLDALPLSAFFSAAVQFASLTMLAMLVAVIWIFDPRRRMALPYLLVALLLAGAVNDGIKLLAGRERPEWTVEARGKRAAEEDLAAAAEETPGSLGRSGSRPDHWLFFSSVRHLSGDRYESFPSGHACSVFVMAAFLMAVYPPGRVVWFIAASGCALARVRFRRHFPEDVLFGGALGWAIAGWVFSLRWPGTLGVRLAEWINIRGRAGNTTVGESVSADPSRGFTLIELLVVVAVIAILAAIALPNFLEAQARAKVARARADLRTVATALESYSADNNGHYPTDQPRIDLTGFVAGPALTTPIAYLSGLGSVIDPFRRDLDLVPADADEAYRYWNLAGRARASDPVPPAVNNGMEANGAWIISSAGPDRADQYPATGDHLYETLTYDPTNGTVSRGDIARSAREAQPR